MNRILILLFPFIVLSQTPSIGDFYEGGYVFYIDSISQSSKVVIGYDLGPQTWGCFYYDLSTNDYNGNYNTNIIMSAVCDQYVSPNGAVVSNANKAAQICYDLNAGGYSDWYLPSREELTEIMTQQSLLPTSLSGYYWSSSQINTLSAWRINSNGFNQSIWKYWENPVRCIRGFTFGCTDELALNFNPNASEDDGSCCFNDSDQIGDVNLDNEVNSQDAAIILQFIVGLIELNNNELLNCDVNLDNEVNSQDASLIIQYVAGLIDAFEGCQ